MSSVRIRVVVGDLELSFSGSETFFHRHVAPLLEGAYARGRARGLFPRPPTPETGATAPADAGEVAEALPPAFVPTSGQFSSFLQKVGPRAANPEQQVVAFAFYLWNYEDRRRVEEQELAGCFEAVGLPPPEPMDGCLLDLCERKRFLSRASNGQTGYVLTPKGVNYVKTRLLGAV